MNGNLQKATRWHFLFLFFLLFIFFCSRQEDKFKIMNEVFADLNRSVDMRKMS